MKQKTWGEACTRWLAEMGHKRSLSRDVDKFKWLSDDGIIPTIQPLNTIKRAAIHGFIQERLKIGNKPATINAYLALIKAVLRKARDEWEWVKEIPHIKLLPLDNARTRWLTPDEIRKLLKELPAHLRLMVEFTLETGLRMRNVCKLQINDVNFKMQKVSVKPEDTKNGKPLIIPLNTAALAIIYRSLATLGGNGPYVFNYKGKPITVANTKAWRKALKRAGIEDFRWHDLRHTWASRHVQAGTSPNILQKLGGWESVKCMERYAHLSDEQLKNAAENIQ